VRTVRPAAPGPAWPGAHPARRRFGPGPPGPAAARPGGGPAAAVSLPAPEPRCYPL